jgi:ABC-type polysaccharide/polyol phosphate export permease
MLALVADRDYWKKIWGTRYFLMSMVQLDLRNRYRRSVLGVGWSLMNPILMTAVLCVVFHKLFHQSLREHAPFVLAGIGIWAFLTTSIMEGCLCIYMGEKYIRSYPLPMAVYPLRTALGTGFHFLIILCLTFAVTLVLKGYSNPLALLAVLPGVLLFFLFGWSLAVLFGFANVYFPDTHQISQVLLQILFYLTPVFYPPDLIQNEVFQAIIRYNPLGAFVNIIRDPLVYSRLPTLETSLFAAVCTVLTTCWALHTLRTQEKKVIFYL